MREARQPQRHKKMWELLTFGEKETNWRNSAYKKEDSVISVCWAWPSSDSSN